MGGQAKARKAGTVQVPQAVYGSPKTPLKLGELTIPCYVLEDGTRVLSMTGTLKAMGMAKGSSSGNRAEDRLSKFAASKRMKPFVNNSLSLRIVSPIRFRSPYGVVAYGYEATVLADLCDAVLAARKAGVLQQQQEHIAAQCELLVRGFARVGIIALVDEATGYQKVRAREALADVLEKFIDRELRPWTRTFPEAFYEELFRLQGWEYSEDIGSADATRQRRPMMVSLLTVDIIYKRLAPGVCEELRRVVPRNDKGRLKRCLHQGLTDDIGHPKLREHMAIVIALMQVATSWEQFMAHLNKVRPPFPPALDGLA